MSKLSCDFIAHHLFQRNVSHNALCKNCANGSAPPSKMAANAVDKKYLQTTSRPLVEIQTNFTLMFLTRCDYNLPIIKSPKQAPNAQGTSWSVLLKVYFKDILLYMVYGLRSEHFLRYYVFNDVNWWGTRSHTRGDLPVIAIECVLS